MTHPLLLILQFTVSILGIILTFQKIIRLFKDERLEQIEKNQRKIIDRLYQIERKYYEEEIN